MKDKGENLIYEVLIHVAAALMAAGVASISYNLATKQVTSIRKPLYWMALVMSLILLSLFVEYIIEEVWGVRFFAPDQAQFMIVIGFFILGLLLTLVPYVDRAEFRVIVQSFEEGVSRGRT